MDITPNLPKGTNFINGYSDSGFRINNNLIQDNIILTPTNIIKWESTANLLEIADFGQIFDEINKAEITSNIILLIGTGGLSIQLPIQVLKSFNKLNIFPEIMTTPAACRTYNVLVVEQRNIYAMLRVKSN